MPKTQQKIKPVLRNTDVSRFMNKHFGNTLQRTKSDWGVSYQFKNNNNIEIEICLRENICEVVLVVSHNIIRHEKIEVLKKEVVYSFLKSVIGKIIDFVNTNKAICYIEQQNVSINSGEIDFKDVSKYINQFVKDKGFKIIHANQYTIKFQYNNKTFIVLLCHQTHSVEIETPCESIINIKVKFCMKPKVAIKKFEKAFKELLDLALFAAS